MDRTKHPCVLAAEVKGSHNPKASAKKPRDFMGNRAGNQQLWAPGTHQRNSCFLLQNSWPKPQLQIPVPRRQFGYIQAPQEFGVGWVWTTNGCRELWWR